MIWLRLLCLRIALWGEYDYMVRTLQADKRLRVAKDVDIVVRKDGNELRFEADWLKRLAKLVKDVTPKPLV
jgi:uncharacterized tellurite resistance protein B-like protein